MKKKSIFIVSMVVISMILIGSCLIENSYAQNKIEERIRAKTFQQITLNKVNSAVDSMPDGIFAGDRNRGGGNIHGPSEGGRDFMRNRHCNTAGSCAYIHEPGRRGAVPQKLDSFFDQYFGLRTRDQNGRRHPERKAVEFPFACQIIQWLA